MRPPLFLLAALCLLGPVGCSSGGGEEEEIENLSGTGGTAGGGGACNALINQGKRVSSMPVRAIDTGLAGGPIAAGTWLLTQVDRQINGTTVRQQTWRFGPFVDANTPVDFEVIWDSEDQGPVHRRGKYLLNSNQIIVSMECGSGAPPVESTVFVYEARGDQLQLYWIRQTDELWTLTRQR